MSETNIMNDNNEQQNTEEIQSQIDELFSIVEDKTLYEPLDVTSKRTIRNQVLFPVTLTLFGANAATAANYSTFFSSSQTYGIISIIESHSANSTSGTLQVQLLKDGIAPGSGIDILDSTIDLAANANSVQEGVLKQGVDFNISNGDRLALVDGGTLTSLTDLQVTIILKVI
jgi:hypothetical protein